tara:strand:+ start:505 stop:1497 length:993 start_codon:yes stop_codon:yes gene_type:complete
MGKTISITPNSGLWDSEPTVKFQGNDSFFSVSINVASGLPPSGSASGVSSLLFEGSQGTLFSVEDNLSSGSIFSVSDITGLPLIEATASGDVKLAEYGQEVISYKPILISGGAPMTTTDKLYNDNGTLKFGDSALDVGTSGWASDTIAITDATVSTVAKGGTNASSFADKAVIITQDSGDDTLAAAVMDANGELLIGGTSGPAVATLTQGSNMTITNADGGITLASSGGAGVSDEELKDNVEDLDINALDKVDELRPVEFDWNQTASDEFNGISGHDMGLIAQEVEQILPKFISEFRGRKTVDYPKLTVILLKAVQELKQEVETLKSTPN